MTIALITIALRTMPLVALKGGNLIDHRVGCSGINRSGINRSVINRSVIDPPPELLSLLPGEYSPVKVSLTKQVDSSH